MLLHKHFNLQESSIDSWPYWMFEENIKIANEITDEEEKERKKDEEKQNLTNNFNPSSYMNNISNMASKFKS